MDLVVPDLPEGTLWGALVLESASGAIVGTTGLVPIRDGRLELEAPGENAATVALYVYREEDVPVLAPFDPARLSPLLQAAQLEDPILPTPALQVIAELTDGATFEPDLRARDLTAPWIPPCERLEVAGSEPSVLLECGLQGCLPTVEQSGCRVSLDLRSGCGVGAIDLRLMPNGQAATRGEAGTFGPCASTVAREKAELSVLCRVESAPDCRVDLYPNAARTRLDVLEVKIVPEAPDVFSGFDWIGGLALLDAAELVVSAAAHPSCAPDGDQRLVFLDRATLEVTRVEVTPYCIQLMRADPMGDGFVGIARAPPAAVRFDRNGVLLDRQLIEGLAPMPEPTPQSWSQSPDGTSAAVWFASPNRLGRSVSSFVEINWSDLSVVRSANRTGTANFPVALIADGFVLVDDHGDLLRYYDELGGIERHVVPLSADSLTSHALSGIARVEQSNRLLVFFNERLVSLAVVDGARNVHRTIASELSQPPRVVAPFPGRDALYLVAAGHQAASAELVAFDVDREYFLPGRTNLNLRDVPAEAVSDGLDAHIFVHFQSTARVVRVRVLPED